ncbi:inactive TPR repeat-containing thioredoxin TTL3-like [Primulina huaijiensis]|uniref:inactive TPR repeat-containing thioredoxin TTL3-like n=1 Tax=Primulina huaijiensis TaxID=1492673 RepID=UPI003CC75E43
MARTAECRVENEKGCGFLSSILNLRSLKPRKSILDSSDFAKPPSGKPLINPTPLQHQETRVPSATRIQMLSPGGLCSQRTSQVVNLSYYEQMNKEPVFTSSDLSLTVSSDQPKFNANGGMYRASTGNVMLIGHLGNLKRHAVEKSLNGDKMVTKHVINGTVMKKSAQASHGFGNVVRSCANKMDSDAMKSLGNDKYKKGQFEEALALYNQAIAIDPCKACYYSNKSAALMGLGRLLEAIVECREAIRIDPLYHNAHYRLGKLYLRLGVAEKAIWHYKSSGRKASFEDFTQAQALKSCVDRCNDAQRLGDWSKLLDESQAALSMGADSATQIHAMKAESLLKLKRHEEAHSIIQNQPSFHIELNIKFFGCSATAGLLLVHALVYMANGRFEDAVTAAQHAMKLDSSSKVKSIFERVKSVTTARLNGNRLFKTSRFTEATYAYTKGLENDPYNSILLCNRAACCAKLGQYEKAVEDCTESLSVRPNYSKPRLRRAHCNVELERWEAAIEDFEVLMQQIPDDQDVKTGLLKAKTQLTNNISHNISTEATDLVLVSGNKNFTYFLSQPGLCVVLFCSKLSSKQDLQLLQHVSRKFPSVNFLKVEIEDNAGIIKSQGVKAVPVFIVYKNGSKAKEIPGDRIDWLERHINLCGQQ